MWRGILRLGLAICVCPSAWAYVNNDSIGSECDPKIGRSLDYIPDIINYKIKTIRGVYTNCEALP